VIYSVCDNLPRRKYGRLIKVVNYPLPEKCPVCKKGIECPVHPDANINCKDHKLNIIIEREKKLDEMNEKNEEKNTKNVKNIFD